jgi:hypothetical protein
MKLITATSKTMNVEITTALEHLNKMARIIEHDGKLIPKKQLFEILTLANKEGLKTIKDIPDSLVNSVLNN